MAIAIALDDDLVGLAPQHRASAPALVAVDLIAKAHGKFAEIDLPFEGVEFAILIPHRKTPFPSLLPVFFLGRSLAFRRCSCRQLGAPTPRAALSWRQLQRRKASDRPRKK